MQDLLGSTAWWNVWVCVWRVAALKSSDSLEAHFKRLRGRDSENKHKKGQTFKSGNPQRNLGKRDRHDLLVKMSMIYLNQTGRCNISVTHPDGNTRGVCWPNKVMSKPLKSSIYFGLTVWSLRDVSEPKLWHHMGGGWGSLIEQTNDVYPRALISIF